MVYTAKELEHIFQIIQIVEKNASGVHSDIAKTYAYHTMQVYHEYGEKGVKMQIPYILSNLQNWRGELAKQTKAHLKSYIR